MTLKVSAAEQLHAPAAPEHGRLSRRWLARTLVGLITFWTAAVLIPQLFGLSGPWRAFGAGLVMPGAGLLYAIPAMHHPMGTAMVLGHAVLIVVEVSVLAWVLRGVGWPAVLGATVGCAGLVVAGCILVPYAVVVAGHLAAFVGVLTACGWAFGIRLIARADSVTLVAIIVMSAAVGAALTSLHGPHPGPATWVPWAALAVMVALVGVLLLRASIAQRSARRLGRERLQYLSQRRAQSSNVQVSPVPLQPSAAMPVVTEASTDQLRFLRYLLGVAGSPTTSWASFDDEAQGPLQQYRYQVNALGWALAAYNYSHTPSYTGVLSAAQLALVERAQQKAVWGYWYWQNLLGNWDFFKRRADPIDVPQNIMFTGYLNLQLAMYRQATGDSSFDEQEALVFDWSPRQRFTFDHQTINSIAIRNFNQDLHLWPCEPVVSPGRRRGFVFPYCNTVTTAGIAIMDTINGTAFAPHIASHVEEVLDREYTRAVNDLAAFMVSGLGLSVRRVMSGTGSTAGVAAFIAPLRPALAWRAWEILKREWLETGLYREPGSTGEEMADWASGAKTNAETLAAAMHLAHAVGDERWHAELWDAAVEQLRFTEDGQPRGVATFATASVHANGMLGFGGLSRPYAFNDMLTKPRPTEWQTGPRLVEVPHPDVLIAKAVSDGAGLDLVMYPGIKNQRVGLRLDHLRPHQSYTAHGAVDDRFTADANGSAQITVDMTGRTTIELRSA